MAYSYPQFYPQYPQYIPQQTQQQQQQQSPSISFVSVQSEEMARNYPIAPGNSVTFKNENAPYIYTKTMGFSQLDRPIFERYKLVKEDDVIEPEPCKCDGEISKLKSEIDKMWNEINELKEQIQNMDRLGA